MNIVPSNTDSESLHLLESWIIPKKDKFSKNSESKIKGTEIKKKYTESSFGAIKNGCCPQFIQTFHRNAKQSIVDVSFEALI